MAPIITVVVPFYKVPKLRFRKCIESLREQTFKDFELLLICDGNAKEFEDFKKVFAVNVDGTFLTNEAVFPYMKENGGNIINFTSASAFIVSPFQPIYGATKGAVTSWSRTLAKDLMPYNIRVNMIAPNIWTPLTDKLVAQFSPEEKQAFMDGMKGLMLGDKPGDLVEDYLPVIAFAASDSSKFITGQTICVDGGTMMVR